ncbi:isochorismate synthase [Flavobacterium sp.]|uniref:isochorismate synthase n=1 Tax=Flavobacterium sp. TaxID=239 RepID=UPI001212734A|nr:isochorismate synthase [Flavobacterium sp.]RZJ72174.1 MAG: isochorismate synthase [Flavobacterium sp.]
MKIFEKAAESLSLGKPFVIFRKPDQTNITGIFQRGKVSHGCNKWTESGFVFAPFDSALCWILPENDSDVVKENFIVSTANSVTPELEIDAKAKLNFEILVAKGVSAIRNGDFEKVVLSRLEEIPIGDFDALDAFGKLAANYPSAFVYLWFHPETDIWMAATPEKLLEANGKDFATMALAGTQKFQGETEVSWPKKEKEEQRFVTDFIWNGLEGLVSDIEIGAPYTTKAGNLLHIRTDISGTLNDAADLGEVISILHPTPAVCGLPKAESKQFILDNEGYGRDYYAGFLGELNLQDGTDLYVNLRCMKVKDGVAQLFIGCGITKDSEPEKEFFETVNKSLTIRKALS